MSFLAHLMGIELPFIIALACFAASALVFIYLRPLMPTVSSLLCAALIGAACSLSGYGQGFSAARNQCAAQAIQTRLDKALMDLAAEKKAREIEANSIEQLNAAEARNQELVDALSNRKAPEPEVPPQPDAAPVAAPGPARDVCHGLSPADVGGLLRIK